MNHHARNSRRPAQRGVPAFIFAVLAGIAVALPAAGAIAPDELVKSTSEDVLTIIRNDPDLGTGNSAALGALVEAKVLHHFAFDRMARLAVGKDWRLADTAQREVVIDEFRTLLVRTYSVALAQFHDQTIEYQPLEMRGEGREAVVRTLITQPSGKAIHMDYRMFLPGEEWKVYDILVDGISLIVNYRSTFNATVASSGIDGLIQLLRDKNAAAN